MEENKNKLSKKSHEKNKLILIIESDDFFRNLIAKRIEERGYRISTAINRKEGLRKIKTERPDLIFLSLTLNGKMEDGFITLGIIKEDFSPTISSIPVVVLSNFGKLEEIDKALELGADDYLIKINSSPKLFLKRIKGNLR